MAQDDSASEEVDKSTEWAEFRTNLAEDRTVQASERTFAGWLRTAFAAIGIGLAFSAIFGDLEPNWLGKAIASLFILLGVTIVYTAERRAARAFDRLSTHQVDRPRMPNLRWMSWAVIVGSLVLIAGIWIFNDGNIDGGPPAPA